MPSYFVPEGEHDPDRSATDASIAATTQLRERIFVGLHPTSYDEASKIAWDIARREHPDATELRVLEKHVSGKNPIHWTGVTVIVS
jgi:hypothetical protein